MLLSTPRGRRRHQYKFSRPWLRLSSVASSIRTRLLSTVYPLLRPAFVLSSAANENDKAHAPLFMIQHAAHFITLPLASQIPRSARPRQIAPVSVRVRLVERLSETHDRVHCPIEAPLLVHMKWQFG
ncbi:hypothetical protein NHJ13734_001829 [Beauveria thailandica]